MSTVFSQQIRDAARGLSRVRLRPPLREAWAHKWKHLMTDLPFEDDDRIYFRDPSSIPLAVVAVDKRSGKLAWRQSAVYRAEGMRQHRLICVSLDGLQVVVPETGAIERSLSPGVISGLGFGSVGDLLICASFESDHHVFSAIDFQSGKEVWRWQSGRDEFVTSHFAANHEAVCFGLRGGPVLALDPRTGRELWRGTVGDFKYKDASDWDKPDVFRPCEVQGVTVIHGDRVIFPVFSFGVVACSVKDGRRLWTHRSNTPSAVALYDGRYYILGSELWVLDPSSGQVLMEKALHAPVSKREDIRPALALLVSDTHIFTGSREGYVLAFERDSGEFVWGHRPKVTGGIGKSTGTSFGATDQHLYYYDMSFRVYCLEHDPEGGAPLGKRAKARARAR